MNEDEKISSKVLIIMFTSCLLLAVITVAAVMFNSPKSLVPEYEFSEPETEEEYFYSESVLEKEEKTDLIGINTATIEELDTIPRIGPATAKLIIDYRNEYGTILSFDELLSISGIGEKTVEILKEYCIIN